MSEDFEELEPEEFEDPIESKSPIGKTISIFFQSTVGPTERKEKIDISANIEISELKYTAGSIFGLPPDQFHIAFAGRTMDPDDILSNYEVSNGDTLLLIPISTAGLK